MRKRPFSYRLTNNSANYCPNMGPLLKIRRVRPYLAHHDRVVRVGRPHTGEFYSNAQVPSLLPLTQVTIKHEFEKLEVQSFFELRLSCIESKSLCHPSTFPVSSCGSRPISAICYKNMICIIQKFIKGINFNVVFTNITILQCRKAFQFFVGRDIEMVEKQCALLSLLFKQGMSSINHISSSSCRNDKIEIQQKAI